MTRFRFRTIRIRTASRMRSSIQAACATASMRGMASLRFRGCIASTPSTVLQVSPFFHYNRADYEPNLNDTPVATTSDRTSNYGGAQASITTEIAHNTLQAGSIRLGSMTAICSARCSTMEAGTRTSPCRMRLRVVSSRRLFRITTSLTTWLTVDCRTETDTLSRAVPRERG